MFRKVLIWSFVVLCLFCHHRLFGRHARACGGSCNVGTVQTFALAQPMVYQQPLVLAAPAVYAAPVVVQQQVVHQPRRQVFVQKTVVRSR